MGIKEILEIKGRVIYWVSLYPRTIFEVREKLVKKGYRDGDIDQALRELEEKKYLDDEQYAVRWIEQQLKNRPCGSLLCKSLMLKKGIPENIITEVLPREYSQEKEQQLAGDLAAEKLKKLVAGKKIPPAKLKQKLGYYLKNKGFTTGIIMEIINQV